MKLWVATASFLFCLNLGWAQAPSSPASCTKNVSFAIAEKGQPVPAIPKFVQKWLGGNSRKEPYAGLCFSQVPSSTMTNYLVVFSSNANAFQGLKASAHTYTSASQKVEGAEPVSSSGGTWAFAYTGATAPATTDTLDLKRDDKPKALDVRTYDQSGRTISEVNLETISSRDKLLEKVFSDIQKDTPSGQIRKPLFSPLYYVNCDVDGQPVSPPVNTAALDPPGAKGSAAEPPAPTPKPAAAPPPPPEFEIWSTPAGADIFLDGQFVGKTPMSVDVAQGEHTVNLRKKNFSIWQRRIQALPGKRRVGGYLEQKVLNLE